MKHDEMNNGNPSGAELTALTRRFAQESRVRSWWVFGSTFTMLLAVMIFVALAPWSWWPARIPAMLLGTLLMVRGFILYHDFMHGTILKKSIVAKLILHFYGLIFLTPPRIWRDTHNFHHANVGKVAEASVGSFPMMTLAQWQAASPFRRFYYRLTRNPLIIVFAYLTIFFYSTVIESLVKHPVKYWDSGLALVVHGGLITLLWLLGGPMLAAVVFIMPFTLATAFGAYLFYAQHNFRGMRVLPQANWNNGQASLESASYLKLDPVMDWFTGNIGYHHVHHYNLGIPFYRLPATMKAIPALQAPVTTTLYPHDVLGCLRLKLWDEEGGKMLSFREARRAMAERA